MRVIYQRLQAAGRSQHGIAMMQGVILFGIILVALTAALVVITNLQQESVSQAGSFTDVCGIDKINAGTFPPGCKSA